MLGHYLMTLTPEQEHRVLTQRFLGVLDSINQRAGRHCLITVTEPGLSYMEALDHLSYGTDPERGATILEWMNRGPAYRYEALCGRFGSTRVNQAIRSRILTNQLWRVLSPVSVAK